MLPSPRAQSGEPNDIKFVREILQPKLPDAIICANDRTAALLIQTLFSLGIRSPQDIRVVGFDDLKYATLLPVPLTTTRQPYKEIGQPQFGRCRNESMIPLSLHDRSCFLWS